jgi:hypothetical protein
MSLPIVIVNYRTAGLTRDRLASSQDEVGVPASLIKSTLGEGGS